MNKDLHLELNKKFVKKSFTPHELELIKDIFGLLPKDVYFEIDVKEIVAKEHKFINFYGSSGEGKTVVKDLLKEQLKLSDEVVYDFDDLGSFFEDNNQKTILEIFDIQTNKDPINKILSYFGLFEMRILLEKLENLSTGQRTRMKYIYLMNQAIHTPGSYILIDEFVTFIDSLSGINFSRGIRKFLDNYDLTLFTFGINDNIIGQFEDISYMITNGKISAKVENGVVTYLSKDFVYMNTRKSKIVETSEHNLDDDW